MAHNSQTPSHIPVIPTLFKALGLAAWALGPVVAFAIDRDFSPMGVRREALSTPGSEIRVEGQLSCRITQDVAGQTCILRIEDYHSGRMFRLKDEAAAMQMYAKGTRTVAVTGKIADFQTLSVLSVESL